MRGLTTGRSLSTMPRGSVAAALYMALALVATSCGALPFAQPSPTRDPFAGVYIARGGGGALETVTPLVQAWSKRHPQVTWQGLDDIGSDAGVKLIQSGEIDLSFISRDLKPAEIGTVNTVPIGATGTAIAVNASNPVTALTRDQLARLFRGDITSWSPVGGPPMPVHVFMREAGAATRSAFESYVFGGNPPTTYAKNAIEVTSYTETVRAMATLDGSIALMSTGAKAYAERSIHLIAVDGVAATHKTVADGTYPMRRPLHLVYAKDPAHVRPAVKDFLDFVKGPEGQAILDSL